jgi:hypothetical protein
MKKPFVCKLPGRMISVEVADYTGAKPYGACGGREHYFLLIRIGEKEVHKTELLNGCNDETTHMIEVHGDYLHDCAIQEIGTLNDKPSCKRIEIP